MQGLPARICLLGYGERDKAELAFNDLVRRGEVSAPIVIGRDHLDAGSLASPYHETEVMRDGLDAIADSPILNALVDTAAGAYWLSVHHGSGVGIGYSITPGWWWSPMAPTRRNDSNGCSFTDPGMGIVRHADAGYEDALAARTHGVRLPWMT